MSQALMWSGGKDSYLALARSKREGRHVSLLVNFYDERSGRVRFHGTRKAVITGVELASLPAAWLGRSIDEAFATDIARHPEVDPCGERGEYHSFVYAGPLFLHHVPWRPGPLHEAAGFAQLELLAR